MEWRGRVDAHTEEWLRTSAGDFPLREYRLRASGREWSILHLGAVLSYEEEVESLGGLFATMPYGVALWPAAIALAHELASRHGELAGTRVLELGAGTGLPGIVAASLGAHVVQMDRNALAMSLCQRNGERNRVHGVEYRTVAWDAVDEAGGYDWILGSDILYGLEAHAQLRRTFETALMATGRVLLSDPFRSDSLALLEAMERDGWQVTLSQWSIGEEDRRRPVAVYELSRLRASSGAPAPLESRSPSTPRPR